MASNLSAERGLPGTPGALLSTGRRSCPQGIPSSGRVAVEDRDELRAFPCHDLAGHHRTDAPRVVATAANDIPQLLGRTIQSQVGVELGRGQCRKVQRDRDLTQQALQLAASVSGQPDCRVRRHPTETMDTATKLAPISPQCGTTGLRPAPHPHGRAGDLGGRSPEHICNAESISTLLVPSRALKNGVYVAYANHTGPDFTGLSCIASPYRTFLGIAGHDEELMFADIDPAEVQCAREINTYVTYRRPELFG